MKRRPIALWQSLICLLLCVSMLVGTTFAWFTDQVVSGKNTIAAGNLDVELYHSNAAVQNEQVKTDTLLFKDLQGNPILWEPGVVSYENLRVTNAGDLALQYQLAMETANENFVVYPDGTMYGLSQILKVGVVEGGITATDRAGVVASVDTANWTTLASFLRSGTLLPAGKGESEKTWGVVIYWQPGDNDNLWNLNNGKQLNTGDVLSIDLGVKLVATQFTSENDSFGPDYDQNATFPGVTGGSVSAQVPAENNIVTADTVLQGNGFKALVPAGTKLADGVTQLTFSVFEKEGSDANLTLDDEEEMYPLDVHIEGTAPDNDKPILVTIEKAMTNGLNIGNYKLYHVENGVANEMTAVDAADLDAHNEFTYDPATGDITLAMQTFSEVAMVAEPPAWEGEFDYSWYTNAVAPVDGEAVEEYIIANGDQLAAFGAIVGGMKEVTGKNEKGGYTYSENIIQNSFSGKTVKLTADINLGDAEGSENAFIFYPIGYYNTEKTYEKTGTTITSGLRNFEGTFDGNGHTISNFYHNTWEMKGDHDWYAAADQNYRDGMGLFGRVYGGTVKNLTVDNFKSDGEIATTGVIAAYADFGATFENIAIFNCNPRVYNIGNGGIVGCVGWYTKGETDKKVTFKNITVDNTNKISALWGSYDVACGGIVGQYYPTSGQTSAGSPKNAGIYMENCHVAAQMDVFNDVCGNYQYYAYRYAGMMIGSIRENLPADANGHIYPNMDKISASGCTVHFGDWNDYYYCELAVNGKASYTHDHKFSRLTQIAEIDIDNKEYLPLGETKWENIPTSGRVNYVIVNAKDGDGKFVHGDGTAYATCYHFVDGKVWNHTDAGKQDGIDENKDGIIDWKEDKILVYREFNQLFTGYGWGVTSKGLKDFDGVENMDITTGHEDSVVKFGGKGVTKLANGTPITIGSLFSLLNNGVELVPGALTVSVNNLDANNPVSVEFNRNVDNWENGTLTLTGKGKVQITITDYYFCTPTTIEVTIEEPQPVEKFETKFTGDFLYRVGSNVGTDGKGNIVKLDSLFKAKDGATIGNVSVTVEPLNGTAASGAYTPNDTWTSGEIAFSGTGIVEVTITDNDYCTPTELILEVVDAKNITTASGSNGTSVVLLNDVKISANGTANYQNCTVYGNGFTFDVRGGMNQYNSKQGHGIIIINNATLDHLRIIGDVYDEYGMYTTTLAGAAQNDYTGVVDATNSIIQNCYIANCAAPIRSNGNTITDTTLYGGTVANLLISGGTNTLTNVTTINHNDGRGVIGMGIVITDGANADSTKLILNGYLKQHNYVYQTDISQITVNDAKTVFDSMFGNQFSAYHIGSNPKAVNTGIISINEEIDLDADHFVDYANTGYQIKNDVSVTFKAYGVDKTVGAAVASVQGGNINNEYADNGNHQGDYLPTFNFALGDQMLAKDNNDDTRYLIGDENGLTAMYPKGESELTLDLTKLVTVSKYAGTSYPVTAKCIDPDGKEQTGTVTLSSKGTYTLVFTINDNVHYDQNGNKINKSVTRTYEVELALDVYEKSIADATMKINSGNLTGEYVSSGTNKKYKMYPLQAIGSIQDDANKDGVLESFDFKKNIQSAVLTPEANNAFSSPTTITITYTGGQILTIVLGTPSNLNSPGASNGGKTFSVKTDSTNGIYLQSDGAVASGSAATGTWPLTSWSFKGTSGKVITDNTKVTINFTKPNDGGCVTGDTMITLADGSKKMIRNVTSKDTLRVWNFYEGKYAYVPAATIINHGSGLWDVITLSFDDGTVVNAVGAHAFFDADLNKFVMITPENTQDYIGHAFAKEAAKGYTTTKLISCKVEKKYTDSYSLVSALHYNFTTEGMFSLTNLVPDLVAGLEVGKNMKYDEAALKEDIEKYGLYTYADFSEYITKETFDAFNAEYIKISVGKGYITYEEIIDLIARFVNN